MKSAMKLGLVSFLLMMSTISFAADPVVLAQVKTSVGFAPPEDQGEHLVQVWDDGTIHYKHRNDLVDQVSLVGQLSAAAVTKLKGQIDALIVGEMIGEDLRCFDAPVIENTVVKSSGESLVIASGPSCALQKMSTAYALNHLLNAIDEMAWSLK